MTTSSTLTGAKDADDTDDSGIIVDEDYSSATKRTSRDDEAKEEKYRLAVENIWSGITEMPKNWKDMTVREQRDWMSVQFDRHMTNLPKSLNSLIVGWVIEGDCGRSASAPRPDWLDHDKFLRGQRFAMNNLAGIFLAELVSLFALFSFGNGLRPLVITGKSSDPYASFKRYLSTANRVKNWYSSDPWIEGTPAHKDIQTVRRMHAIVRKRLADSNLEEIDRESTIEKSWSTTQSALLEDFRESCPAAAPGQCPYAFSEDDRYRIPKGMNQLEMATTQSGFVCFAILHPEYFGIHGATDENLDDFCHLWRSLGYLLGMEDEFNFCAGTIDEVKQRSRDMLEYWVKPNLREVTPEWEHMLRCVMTGIRYYFPSITYEHGALYVAELLNIRLPRLEASLSYRQWFRYKMIKLTLHWTTRWSWVAAGMNRGLILCMERGLKYTEAKLDELKKQSIITMSKGIDDTAAAQKNLSSLTHWHKNSFFVLLSTCLLLSLPLVVKKFARMFLLIEAGSGLSS